MTNEVESESNESKIAALMRSLDINALAPDTAMLEALCIQATAKFEEAQSRTGLETHPAKVQLNTATSKHTRSKPMITLLASRSLATAVAIMSAIALWLNLSPTSSALNATPFSKVLSELRSANSLQLKVSKDGVAANVLVRTPGLVRWEESPQKYQIAAGSRLWQIDETQNTATESDSPWFLGPQEQIDLLGLLNAGVSDASRLLDARPVEYASRDGRECLIYRVALPAGNERIDVEAAADAKSLQLVEILAWKSGSRRTGPPLAEMQLVAMNLPVADEKFAVSKSLTEDGRIGKISDAQGIVVLRPMLAKRWTPICRETLLRPGDWIRTELRGANAVKVTLSSDVEITLGPGTLLECISPTEARLHSGIVKAVTPKPNTVEESWRFSLLGPHDEKRGIDVGQTLLVRTDRNEKLVDVGQTPQWLAGFEGTSNNESLGSLIVTLPDGRNEPLTVGYHKVSVEIRDQIARTTIEESFVNHTPGRLEGVFHFPLPQDASISGFGMWIGNDLVEADVVEKQRAREIYETILREKRDPGLLEWTGGNIFKARVFPIEARSEKRIKIVYTQVLPLRANQYRYSYGLRSELLRTSPLRELSLSVTVNSALALKSVTCPTHTARIATSGERTGVSSPRKSAADENSVEKGNTETRKANAQTLAFHSAQVEFSAQEYSPTRDFEVVCEIDGRQQDVVVVPHQRGDDGYFLMQLTPPGTDGNWQREVLPDGEPLHLVLLCDTSMSMDAEKRREQAEFVASVLASLGPEDRFQLVAADVKPVWASAEPLVANAENIAAASKFLSDRVSLGWTDLDRAFDDVLSKAPADANIVYIGDGILSAGDTDPAAFVKRLAILRSRIRQNSDAAASKNPNSDESGYGSALHAVTVGNSNDSVVMRGIATVGGGSVRSINGEQTPQIAALELLNEIAQPGLRDLNVEFKGLKVAAVYPEELPNVAAGTQQILVGRYLPEGINQQGEIVVTGKRGTDDVRYVARVNLKDAEEGNSFIPRLWARSHLDQLLAQGGSQAVQDDIIRLSEEFHIITPYTSLLVLETDTDRERFGVQRRYEMRDGERFFAQGRADANFGLLQQQMKRAGDWRIGLRRRILSNFAGMGRDASAFQQQVQQLEQFRRLSGMRGAYAASGPESLGRLSESEYYFRDEPHFGYGNSTNFGGLGGGGVFGGGSVGESLDDDAPFDDELSTVNQSIQNGDAIDMVKEMDMKEEVASGLESDEKLMLSLSYKNTSFAGRDRKQAKFDSESDFSMAGLFGSQKAKRQLGLELNFRMGGRPNSPFGRGYITDQPDYTAWMNSLFPLLSPVPVDDNANQGTDISRSPGWSQEAIELAKSLLRTESLLAMDGGIEMQRDIEYLDPRWKRSSGRSVDLALYSPTAWLTRGNNVTEQTIVNYCDAQERSVYSLAFGLGRTRTSAAKELQLPPFGLTDSSLTSLHETYAGWNTAIEPISDNQVRLLLTMKNATNAVHFAIDTTRHVILKQETFNDGKPSHSIMFDDFVEVAGTWWARRIMQTNDQGQTISDTQLNIQTLTKDEYAQRLQQQLAEKPLVQFIRQPFTSVKAARQHVADGSATFDDRLTMILQNAQIQQWDEMWKHVDAAEKLAADKSGVRWIRTLLFATIRRNEEASVRLIEEAQRLIRQPSQDEVFLAEFIVGQSGGLSAAPELFMLHQSLKPVYGRNLAERIPVIPARWPNDAAAEQRLRDGLSQRIMTLWDNREANMLEQLGRREDALLVWRANAESQPWDVYAHQNYAQRLEIGGEFDAAHAWLRQELARPERSPYDDEILRSAVAELYRKQGKWNELQTWTTDWISRNPETTSYHSPYGQHISAMIFNDQLESAYALAQQWLNEGRVEGKMTDLQRLRFDAALNLANGQVQNLYFQRIDERWLEPLAETARFFVRHPHHFDIAQRCISNYYFNQTDVADQLRGEWLTILRNEAATLTPTQLNSLVGWTLNGRMELPEPLNDRKQLDATEVPIEIWTKIAETLKSRWLQMQDGNDKRMLGESLVSIYSNRFRDTLLLPFLRDRITATKNDAKEAYISVLFENLLTTTWTNEIEVEAFSVLRRLSDDEDAYERLTVELPALYRLTDAMLANRIVAGETQLSDQGELNTLTRKELASKKADITKLAQTELATRIAELARTAEEPLAAWLRMEQVWLDVQLMQNLNAAEAACWNILGDKPPKLQDDSDSDEDSSAASSVEQRREFFEMQLKQRVFTTLMRLAARSKAEPQSIDRLLKYIDAGIANGGDSAESWRQAKFQILVALDRADDLESELREWIRVDVSTAQWRQMLARLLAERGKIDEAITLFEACKKDKLLTATDYRMLADWYLVSNRRNEYEKSRIESYRQMPEDTLAQMLYQTQNRWSRNDMPLPSELSEDTLFALKALFEKSASPENYFYQVRALYGACRDFRLLQILPDAMLGRSPQQVYSFLQSVNNNVLVELRNEATADELLARIRELREAERTITDLRALDLLESLVERKSAEILNQPGPHVAACLSAMQRAFQREWTEGEPAMMASFLFQLSKLPNETIKTEQLRELAELQKLAPAQSRDHLSITADLSQLMFFSYGQHDEALAMMQIEVRDYVQANASKWPLADHEILSRYIAMLENANRHAAGEQLLQKFIATPVNDTQTTWLIDRLMSLYNHALEHNGAVSIGTGRANVFGPIVAMSLKELAIAPDENVRYNLIVRLTQTFDTAHRHELPATKDAVHKFAFETIPTVLKQQQQQYRNTATHPVHLIQTVLPAREALQYVVERIEQYPQRFEVQYDTSWHAFGSQLASLRAAVGNSDLDERVLKIAIAQLKTYLRTGDLNNPGIFYHGYSEFWTKKQSDFAAAAEEILNDRRSSGRRAMIVAQYFRSGLAMFPRAIEILHIANGKGLLNESEQHTLANWLREQNRYGEMIPIMEPLVKFHPDNMNYRTDLMTAYFHSQRSEQLQTLIAETDSHFHIGGRWTEGNVAQFGNGCVAVNDFKRAKRYFGEVIALHQRANPGSGLNNNTLSQYYQNLASAESALGNTKNAVTAAMSSIVCWDARHEYRQYAINSLQAAVNGAKDLDSFVAQLDAEAAESGQDNPILRKAIGQTYVNRAEHTKAIVQFRLALELQPNDKEVHQALIASFDATEDKAAAGAQLRQLIDLQPHDLELYKQLAERMKDNPQESERAATSIIESSPIEAESHAAMAELRQTQDRWAEAIPHWEQVARYRKLEPTGLLKLAEAQIHEEKFSEAKMTLSTLLHTEWPARFGDINAQVRQLQESFPK